MGHLERKSFKLPCGKTLAQSWGALRKAWLAFKIAHSNYDYDKMSEYAHIIRNLQIQMGIQVTIFDEDLLDDQSEIGPYNENLALETEQDEQNPEQNELERTPEYDWNKDIILHTPIPDPRHEIFLRKMEKSCPLPDKPTTAIVHKEAINYNMSCHVGPPSLNESPGSVDNDRSCYRGPTFYPQKRLDKLKSPEHRMDRQDSFDRGAQSYSLPGKKTCWYKVKKRKGAITKLGERAG